MKIELDLPQVPEGWRCMGINSPSKNQGYISSEDGDFYVCEYDHMIDRYMLTFERIEPVEKNMEKEEIKPQLIIPEGWECIGYQYPIKGDLYLDVNGNFETQEINHSMCGNHLCFRKIEPPDHKLEEAKKKFPVGSYYRDADYGDTILKVRQVCRFGSPHRIVIKADSDDSDIEMFNFDVPDCTPFPIPVWRCCESDKPKKTKNCFMRSKKCLIPSHIDVYLNELGIWEKLSDRQANKYEWLDEGEK